MEWFPHKAETSGRRDLVFGLDVELFAALLKNDHSFFDKSQHYFRTYDVGFRKNRTATWLMPLIVLK